MAAPGNPRPASARRYRCVRRGSAGPVPTRRSPRRPRSRRAMDRRRPARSMAARWAPCRPAPGPGNRGSSGGPCGRRTSRTCARAGRRVAHAMQRGRRRPAVLACRCRWGSRRNDRVAPRRWSPPPRRRRARWRSPRRCARARIASATRTSAAGAGTCRAPTRPIAVAGAAAGWRARSTARRSMRRHAPRRSGHVAGSVRSPT